MISTKGFTLVEVMIAVAIIAILVSIAMPRYLDYVLMSALDGCYKSMAPGQMVIDNIIQSSQGSAETIALESLPGIDDIEACDEVRVNGNENGDATLIGVVNDITLTIERDGGSGEWSCLSSSERLAPEICLP